jgi:hypothetical protein
MKKRMLFKDLLSNCSLTTHSMITEFEFTLPIGYLDASGVSHKKGVMRMAVVADEITPLTDIRVQKKPEYIQVIILSRVITKLGTVDMITPKVIEDLYQADYIYLQDFYTRINKPVKQQNED